ncbi:MAG: amidohydrolase family protein [Planctomycetes bacterium]|nr:amidohydrolase family protein [Planctomycetota bacterium]
MTNDSPLVREFMETGKCESCPVIDTHAHFGPFQGIYFPNVTAEDMIATMDRCGVKKLVFSSHASLIDPRRGNPISLDTCRKYPGRLYAYWSINPNYPELIPDDLSKFPFIEEFVGFKFLPSYHQYSITDKNCQPVFEYANANKCIVLCHTWGGNLYNGPQQVEEIVGKYPDMTFLMGHSLSGAWEDAFRIAKEHPNAYLELCGIYHHGGVIEQMCGQVGSHKITFGTDLPWFDPHYGIGCVLFSHIGDEDIHNILHRNAERIFGWS